MKRIMILIAFIGYVIMAGAQTFHYGDTLLLGQRWPTYYYWGDNWFDSHLDVGGEVSGNSIGQSWCKPEFARYIYTDSSLRVVGIAAHLSFHVTKNTDRVPDCNPFKDYQTEYFRLYEVDSTTDEMILLAEKPVDTSQAAVACYLPYNREIPIFGSRPKGTPIREVYFDSAITVHDSFYVAVTGNNSYRRHYPDFDCKIFTNIGGVLIMDAEGEPLVLPQPNHFRRKLHLVDDWDYDFRYGITDTNWHVFHKPWTNWDSLSLSKEVEWGYFMMIFPILDTTLNHTWVPECKRPVNFGTVHVGREVVVLGWESEGSNRWEVKVAKESEGLDSVPPTVCTSDVLPVYGLDTATWYIATVRSICGENRISEWSDTIRFFVPGDTTATGDDPQEGIGTVVERYTFMMPNPVSDQVTVMSSFRIERIEIYTLTGQRVMHEKVGGLSSQVDISSLPKGTYIVRIHTNRGVSSKRLVVK